MRRKQKSKKPMIAGILMIIAFLIAILTASGVFFLDLDTMDFEDEIGEELDPDLFDTVLNVCGVLILIFGIFLMIGGIFAIKRVHWSISMLGAILGLFSLGPWFFGSILSFIALILLFLSKDEFKREGEYPQSR